MHEPPPRPELAPEGVRTLLVDSQRCPVCRRVALRGRQTVCSARCRRERSRRREAEALRARAQEIRSLLERALIVLTTPIDNGGN